MTTSAQISHMERSLKLIYDIVQSPPKQDNYPIMMGNNVIGTCTSSNGFKYIHQLTPLTDGRFSINLFTY